MQINLYDPEECFDYALNVLEAPFLAGEPAIASSAECSYYYAREVLSAPFPAGEPSIAKFPEYSYRYARDVLRAPFPAGEDTIAKSAIYSYDYALDVLRAPFPAGECAIARSRNTTIGLRYATYVLKDSIPGTWASRYVKGKGVYDPWFYLRNPSIVGEKAV